MNDQRFNSMHLDTSPRREAFRQARARLLGTCGEHTLMCDSERLLEPAETGPRTLVQLPADKPAGAEFWLCDTEGLYPLRLGVNSIGRMPDNDVVIADGSVSRRHCAIVVHASHGCELHDTASKNGTYVNGKRIQGPLRLAHGDEIRMCEHKIIFQTESPAPVDPADPGHSPTLG